MSSGAKTILLINELGTGLGHVAALLPIGTALAQHGHRVVFAMADILRAAISIRLAGFPVLQAPHWPGRRTEKPTSYADLLELNGYGSVSALSLKVQAWQDLYDLVEPDLIVADHSPTAALAAYRTTPTVLVGNGFAMPPHDLPVFPVLQPGGAALTSETRLLEVVGEVQSQRRRPAPETLPGLLASEFRAVLTLPELDPYLGQRDERVLGPIEPFPPYLPVSAGRTVYAYLGMEHPEISEIVAGLAMADADVTCHLRGDDGRLSEFLTGRGVTVLEDPADLASMLPGCTAVVSYASGGMSHAALAAGRPQLTLPYDLEKYAAAAALEGLGVSCTIGSGMAASEVAVRIGTLIGDAKFAHQAAVCAQSILARTQVDALGIIVDSCEELLA